MLATLAKGVFPGKLLAPVMGDSHVAGLRPEMADPIYPADPARCHLIFENCLNLFRVVPLSEY